MHLLSAVIERARGRNASPDACLFDIFGTFVLRRCTAPDGVFKLAWRNMAAADAPTSLCPLFESIPTLDAEAAKAIRKTRPARVDAFFRRHGQATISGIEFTAALPTLLRPDEFASMAARIRDQLLAYLRASIRGFDTCTASCWSTSVIRRPFRRRCASASISPAAACACAFPC